MMSAVERVAVALTTVVRARFSTQTIGREGLIGREGVATVDFGPDGEVAVASEAFGRPQGLAFDSQGRLHVVEALSGVSGLYRFDHDGVARLLVAGAALVGVAFDRAGHLSVTSNETAYRFRASLLA